MARFVKRHVPSGTQVLEVGCGAGANAHWLSPEYRVSAVDVSRAAVSKAMFGRAEIDIRVADATDLPFDNNKFDCVIDVCCLQHVPVVDLALTEVYRVLKANGWLFSVWAGHEHSDMAFPAGIYTRKLIDGIEAFYLLRKHKFEEINTYRARYEDEVYGSIEHWLIHGQKLAMKG